MAVYGSGSQSILVGQRLDFVGIGLGMIPGKGYRARTGRVTELGLITGCSGKLGLY